MGERAYTVFFLAALQYLVGKGVRSAIKKTAPNPWPRRAGTLHTWDLFNAKVILSQSLSRFSTSFNSFFSFLLSPTK